MTDEEKAEIIKEYLINTFKQTEENQLAIMIGSKCFSEGLEKGLAEGRKETESHLLENWCRNEDDYCPHLKQLEKENEQLNEQIKKMKPYCKKLCKNYQESLFMNNDCINGVCRNCNKWEVAE